MLINTVTPSDIYDVIFSGANGNIIHYSLQEEIRLIPTNGTTIIIADKDVGASVAGTTSSSWGNRYNFSSLPTAPSGYHIPTKTEWENLMTLWKNITWSTDVGLFMTHLLLPGAGFKNSSNVQTDIGNGLYWSSTSNDSSTAWGTIFYPEQSGYWYMLAHSKTNQLTVRLFKD